MFIEAPVVGCIRDARERRPLLDHLVRTVQHFGEVNGSALAAAFTYFAFLSFFPVVALGFVVVGALSAVFPNADDALTTALESLLPLLRALPPVVLLTTGGEVTVRPIRAAAMLSASAALICGTSTAEGGLALKPGTNELPTLIT